MTVVPGPNMFQIIQQYLKDPFQMFAVAQTQWGDLVRFSAMGYDLYQVTSPDLAQIVLKNPEFQVSTIVEHTFMGRGLVNNFGDSWKNQRRLMQPHFHHRAIAGFAEQMITATQSMASQWQHGQIISTLSSLTRLNHQILGTTILDIDFYQEPELLSALQTIRNYLNRRFQAILPVPEAIPSPRNLAFKRAVVLWNDVIHQKIQQARSNDITLLSMLHYARDPRTNYEMNIQQLHHEINTLFFNGYEDPAATITWILYLLSQNPNTRLTLEDEIGQIVGTRAPIPDDLTEMSHLDNIINETLRLFPPTWAVMRDTHSDTMLGGYVIPKGAIVQVNIYLLHRHPDYWQQANEFLPNRFTKDYPQSAYMPFGIGPRQCIGKAFSLMQIKLVLIILLQKYRYELINPDVKIDAQSSLSPNGDLFLKLCEP